MLFIHCEYRIKVTIKLSFQIGTFVKTSTQNQIFPGKLVSSVFQISCPTRKHASFTQLANFINLLTFIVGHHSWTLLNYKQFPLFPEMSNLMLMKLASSLTFCYWETSQDVGLQFGSFLLSFGCCSNDSFWLFYMMIQLLFWGIKIGIEEKKVKQKER